MKKALVHDWYYVNGGAEKVIHSINNIWNDLEHYALIDFLTKKDREFILNNKKVHTSFIQKLPTAKNNHRKFLQFFPYAVEQFDLNEYDLILSSSASIAKGVITNHDQLHICYCHSPMRYAWDFYHQYLEEANLKKGLKSLYAKYVLHKTRIWDIINSNRVDHFIANSEYIAKRIKKVYNRDSNVIYPPVNIDKFPLKKDKDDFFFTASRMVSYKKIDLIVQAFNEMPNKKLVVAGSGPDFNKIKKMAKSNIVLKGFVEENELISLMQNAKAFVFAAEEDFGIIPVEAQACGTPVIGFNKGGLKETVLDKKTGILFRRQRINDVVEAVKQFEKESFDPDFIRNHASRFSKERFEKEMKAFVEEKYDNFIKRA
ncbi:glycosyltransferase [Aquimarina sp. MMG016]|uniref:glycosyltransferase n=1 Tax=Aquimarina sp. MMG016 TaxID=2822690 RepID=UPI001B3A1C4D|nr:glycosyltransferase [Aquimarina sp. MMG016]MBQ4820090.1 glycosyltransferase [Aquimarina sp. MMG016]